MSSFFAIQNNHVIIVSGEIILLKIVDIFPAALRSAGHPVHMF